MFLLDGLKLEPLFMFSLGLVCAHMGRSALESLLSEIYVLMLSFRVFRPIMWTRKDLQKRLKQRHSSSSYGFLDGVLTRLELSALRFLNSHQKAQEEVFVDLEDAYRIPIFKAIWESDKKALRKLMVEHYDDVNSAGAKPFLFAVLLQEALHKRIALLSAKRIIPLSVWASQNAIKGNVAANKAKRQTIPAFRLREKWMIAEDFSLREPV
jgi:hypothetical protein